MDYKEVKKWLHENVKNAVAKWQPEQFRNVNADYFLFYKRGEIRIARELPGDDWDIASNRRVTGTKEQAFQFCYNLLHELPCLPREEK